MRESRFVTSLVLLSSVTCCAGCGARSNRVPVEGVVTLDGQPLAGAQILFDQPELSRNENTGYIGRTDAVGRYSLRPMIGEGSGVPPGEFRVSLTTAVVDASAPPPKPPTGGSSLFYPEEFPTLPERVPPDYQGGKLKFTVPPEGTDKADFALVTK